MIIVDIEANGLLEDANEIHCICMMNLDNSERYSFHGDFLDEALLVLDSNSTCIMHNGVGYDIPLLKSIFGFNYKGRVIDTMLMSQFLYPERPGGHSLESFGQKLGFPKVEHEDWSVFTPEMLHRCETDVTLTSMVYQALCSEAGETIEGFSLPEYRFYKQEA